jgi:asparagine synthetase B (glutamine-hydrolysing)
VRPDWAWRDIAATPERDLVRETSALIERAVLRAVPANVKKVALPLSGGLDSRLLAAVLARHGVPVRAYNIDSGHEAAIARQVASTLKLPLRTLGMLDRPAAIPEAHRAVDGAYHVNQVWGWEMARRAAEEDGCDALFDGLAFDAILGAVHHLAGTDADSLAANLEANYADVCEGTLTRLVSPAAAATYGTVRSSPARLAREALEQAGARASDYFLMTNRVRKYTFGYCLANLHPLPGRFPYVTTALLEHCLGLPRELRLEYNLYRRLYRELFPELAAIPWAKTMLPGAAA